MKLRQSLRFLSIVILLTQTAFVCSAQDSINKKYYSNNDRHWFAEIPIWVPGFRGQLAYGDFNLSSSGDKEEKDFERLSGETGIEFYFVGRIAARYNKFMFQFDAFSGEVGSAFTYNSLIGNVEKQLVNVKIQSTIPRVIVGYSVWQRSNKKNFKIELIPHVGLRYVSFHLQSDLLDSAIAIDVRPHWFEPLIGIFVPIDYKRFRFEIQADFGAIESKYSWVISNRYRYRISRLIDVQLGWNLIKLYHKGTVVNQELEATIRLFGPTAGVGFRF